MWKEVRSGRKSCSTDLTVGEVVVGIGISFVPSFVSSNVDGGSFFWNLEFICAQIPLAYIFVYQECLFGRVNLNIWYVLCKQLLWTLPVVLLLLPFAALPFLGNATNLKDVYRYFLHVFAAHRKRHAHLCFRNLYNATLCFVGESTLHGCEAGAGLVTVLTAFALLLYIATATGVVKYGSASLQVLVQAVSLPLSDFVYTWSNFSWDCCICSILTFVTRVCYEELH